MFGHQDDQNPAGEHQADDNQQSVVSPSGDGLEGHPDEKPADLPTPHNNNHDSPEKKSENHQQAPENKSQDASSGDLLSVKQQALQQLSPLIDHLDQSPVEKFRTTMMMIQAADDQSLIQRAYEAAQDIKDEKVRAQALLDIVNEINYFTQHSK